MLRLSLLALSTVLWTSAANAEGLKLKDLELQVYLGETRSGEELLKTTKGPAVTRIGTDARLKDRAGKAGKGAWKEFRQRAVLEVQPNGDILTYDRWIDLDGATQQIKLFQFEGQWRLSLFGAVRDGRKPKPKVTQLKASAVQVVLDERLPSLVALAVERSAGKASVDYVRVDDGSSGRLALRKEALVDAGGKRYVRHLLDNDKLHLAVLCDADGRVLSVQGIGGWRAVAKGVQLPGQLKPYTDPAPPPAADSNAAQPDASGLPSAPPSAPPATPPSGPPSQPPAAPPTAPPATGTPDGPG